MGTTVRAARANLHALLVAATTGGGDPRGAGVQPAFGPPVNYEANEVIALLGTSSVDSETATLGTDRMRQRETYDLRVMLKVYKPGAGYSDVAALDDRAWELYDLLRDVVQGNPTLDDALVDGWAIVGAGDGEDGPMPAGDEEVGGVTGWVEYVPAIVRCEARVT